MSNWTGLGQKGNVMRVVSRLQKEVEGDEKL